VKVAFNVGLEEIATKPRKFERDQTKQTFFEEFSVGIFQNSGLTVAKTSRQNDRYVSGCAGPANKSRVDLYFVVIRIPRVIIRKGAHSSLQK